MSLSLDIACVNEYIQALSDLTGDPTMPSQQQTLLLNLYLHGPIHQSKLEELTGVKSSSNSRNILKLGNGVVFGEGGPGLVDSHDDPVNRRMKRVLLTPKGHALMEECWKRSFGKYEKLRAKTEATA